MKVSKTLFVLLLTVVTARAVFAGDDSMSVKIFGFNQMQFDTANFSLRKLRLGTKIPIEIATGFNIQLVAYGDLDYGTPSLGFLKVDVKQGDCWTLSFGQDLGVGTSQTDPPFARRTLYYPAAGLFTPAYGLGIFSYYQKGKYWQALSITNMEEDNGVKDKSLDFSSRGILTMSLGRAGETLQFAHIFMAGRRGQDDRTIYGLDATLNGRLYLNVAHNWMDYRGHQRGGWITATYNLEKVIQPVVTFEYLHKDGESAYGRVYGVNFLTSKNSVVRLQYYTQPFIRRPHGGAMFQVTF